MVLIRDYKRLLSLNLIKNAGCETFFYLGRLIFKGYVSFRESITIYHLVHCSRIVGKRGINLDLLTVFEFTQQGLLICIRHRVML